MNDIIEIGDTNYPLTISRQEIDNHHDLVGSTVTVNEYANEVLPDKHGDQGTVIGVIERLGAVVGYQVKLDDTHTVLAPVKDFYLSKQIVEDYIDNNYDVLAIEDLIGDYLTQRSFYGISWDGIEKYHFNLAYGIGSLALEFAGWYKYPSSTRGDMDGKDWRLIAHNSSGSLTSINCHSILHDGAWTLSTTITNNSEINKDLLNFVGNADHWKRSMLWSVGVAHGLQTSGYDYGKTIDEMVFRYNAVDQLHVIKNNIIKDINIAANKLGLYNSMPVYISMAINKWNLPQHKIASYGKTNGRKWGVITVHPKALDNPDYLQDVIKHELIHAVFDKQKLDGTPHDKEFKALALLVGLPKKYMD